MSGDDRDGLAVSAVVAVSAVTATPLKLKPLFRHPEISGDFILSKFGLNRTKPRSSELALKCVRSVSRFGSGNAKTCDPSDHLQESPAPGPPGPKSQQKSQKESFCGSAKKSPKIPETFKKYAKLDFLGYFLTFRVFSGTFLLTPKKTRLEIFFFDFGPGGKWSLGSQAKTVPGAPSHPMLCLLRHSTHTCY